MIEAAITFKDGIGFDDIVAVFAGVATIITTMTLMLRPIRKQLHWLNSFKVDWEGTPSAPGRDATPSVMERLAAIDGELQRNSGKSMKDIVHQTKRDVENISKAVTDIAAQVEVLTECREAEHDRVYAALIEIQEHIVSKETL